MFPICSDLRIPNVCCSSDTPSKRSVEEYEQILENVPEQVPIPTQVPVPAQVTNTFNIPTSGDISVNFSNPVDQSHQIKVAFPYFNLIKKSV